MSDAGPRAYTFADELPDTGSDIAADHSPDGFPHARVQKYWRARLDYSEAVNKDNIKDFEEAASWYRGGEHEWKGADKTFWNGIEIASNTWHRDVNILTSFLLHSDPRIMVNSEKGQDFLGASRAMETLATKTYREMRYAEEIKKALIESLFRNRSYVFQGWDSYRGLPTIRWCAEEVFIDPDCFGDMKRAGWIAEKFTARLEDFLDDPDIADDIKTDLKLKKDLHQFTRPDRMAQLDPDSTSSTSPSNDPRVWDGQPGFTKVIAYRIFSRDGMLPGYRGADTVDDDNVGDDPGPQADNPHIPIPPPERTLDKPPAPMVSDPIDEGRRVFILLVKGYDKVLKVAPWHMDHYERDEFPYEQLKLNELPGDINGVPMFKIIRPILRVMNYIISFEMAEAKATARRLIEVDTNKVNEPGELDKIESGKHLEAIKVQGINGINTVEFKGRNPRNIEFYQLLKSIHDETSGVNDAIRGQTGTVEKTKAEALMLHDSATASFGALTDAVERFNEDIARKTVMALWRYVPKQTVYPACNTCGEPCSQCEWQEYASEDCPECAGLGTTKGSGQVPSENVADMSAAGPGMMPCPTCDGSGFDTQAIREGRPIQKGSDWWLSQEKTQFWRDDLTVEQIRTSVTIDVEPGSTRRDYAERRLQMLQQLYQMLGPTYQQAGLFRPLGELIHEIVQATELPTADFLAPTDEEWAGAGQAFQAAQQAQQQQNKPPPGPSPEEQQAEQAKQQQAAAEAQAEQQHKQNELAAKTGIEHRRLDLEERRVASEERTKQAETAPQAALGDAIQQHAAQQGQAQNATMQLLATLTQAADGIKASAQTAQATVAAMLQATQAAGGPKKIILKRGAGGRIQSAEVIPTATAA